MTTFINETPTARVRIGMLALLYCGERLPLQVCQSAAGFYIGTWTDDGPCSRESLEYFRRRELAEQALANGLWTQRTEAV